MTWFYSWGDVGENASGRTLETEQRYSAIVGHDHAESRNGLHEKSSQKLCCGRAAMGRLLQDTMTHRLGAWMKPLAPIAIEFPAVGAMFAFPTSGPTAIASATTPIANGAKLTALAPQSYRARSRRRADPLFLQVRSAAGRRSSSTEGLFRGNPESPR